VIYYKSTITKTLSFIFKVEKFGDNDVDVFAEVVFKRYGIHQPINSRRYEIYPKYLTENTEDVIPITKEQEGIALRKIIKWLVPNAVEFNNRVVNYTLTNTIGGLKRKLGRTTEYEIRKNLKKVSHEPNKIVYSSTITDGSHYEFVIESTDRPMGRLHIKMIPAFGERAPVHEITMGI